MHGNFLPSKNPGIGNPMIAEFLSFGPLSSPGKREFEMGAEVTGLSLFDALAVQL